MKQKKSSVTPERIMQFAWSYAPVLAIEAAVRHGIFDVLDTKPLTADQVAAKTRTSKRGVNGLLDLLAGFGLLHKKGERFALAPDTSAFLVSSKPAFYGALYRHMVGQ